MVRKVYGEPSLPARALATWHKAMAALRVVTKFTLLLQHIILCLRQWMLFETTFRIYLTIKGSIYNQSLNSGFPADHVNSQSPPSTEKPRDLQHMSCFAEN